LKINAKRFGRKKFTLIFATRFEKKRVFFETRFTDKGRKKFQVFSIKVWWL